MPRDIAIIGTGGTSREIVDALEAANRAGADWNILGFVDDNRALEGAVFYGGLRVLGPSAAVAAPPLENAAVAIGVANDRRLLIRKEIRASLALDDDRSPPVIHPAASISPHAVIGAGCVILAGVSCSGLASLGRHVVVLQNTVIAHDVQIADYATVAAAVVMGGNVRIDEGAYIGQGSMLFPGVRIGAQSKVGMGAVVLRDVPAGVTVVGNPARILDKSARQTRSASHSQTT